MLYYINFINNINFCVLINTLGEYCEFLKFYFISLKKGNFLNAFFTNLYSARPNVESVCKQGESSARKVRRKDFATNRQAQKLQEPVPATEPAADNGLRDHGPR